MTFLENWFRTAMDPEGLTAFYTIERAHRVLAKPLAPGRPPRPVVARLLHFRDRDLLLQKARMGGPFAVDKQR